jgi:hypothetical protein
MACAERHRDRSAMPSVTKAWITRLERQPQTASAKA